MEVMFVFFLMNWCMSVTESGSHEFSVVWFMFWIWC